MHMCVHFFIFGRGVELGPSISFLSLRVTDYLCGDHRLTRTMVLVLAGYTPQEAKQPQEIKSKICHSAVSRNSLDTNENNLQTGKLPD